MVLCDKSNRIEWVDFAKGIAILLVIIGHTIGNYYVRSIIFSFHMPLFFILSGFTFRPSQNKDNFLFSTKKSFKRLIVPAYCIWVIRYILNHFINNRSYSSIQLFYSGIYASGVSINSRYGTFPAFGMMWFLVVLFFIRIISDLMNLLIKKESLRGIITIFLCELGILIGKKIFLFLSFDIVLVSIIFFFAGLLLRNIFFTISNLSKKTFLISLIIWIGLLILCFSNTKHFELASRDYPFNLLCILMAMAGSYVCTYVCIRLRGVLTSITQKLTILGQNSLIMFTIHAFDTVWYPYIQLLPNKILVLFVRLGIDLLIFFIILIIKKTCIKISAYKG